MIKQIALAGMLLVGGMVFGQEIIASMQKKENELAGWVPSSNTAVSVTNGKIELTQSGKIEGVFSRYLDDSLIQFRIEECDSIFYITGKNYRLPIIRPKRGLYTVPAMGNTPGKKLLSLRFQRKKLVFSEFQSSKTPNANAVMVSKQGEEIVISMPVKDKPDSLDLTLYAVDTGKNWKFKGMWQPLDWPGVPMRLTPEKDGIYRARFKLPQLSTGFSAPALTMIAEVHMLGADSRDFGNFYGFFPFEVKIQAGKVPAANTSLKIYDLGPKNIAPQNGAVRGDQSLAWTGLARFGGGGRIAGYDPMITSWAEINPGKTAKAVLKVKPGKYQIAIGLGNTTRPAYATHKHQPTGGCVKINGKEIFRRNSAEQNRDHFMRRYADENDNFYRLYFKDLIFFDLDAEAEAGEKGIELEFTADPQKFMVLNYLIVHSADDKAAGERLAHIRKVRENRYNRYLTMEKPKQKPFQLKTPFAVFARENPDDTLRPDTLPLESEKKRPLMLFGASDEMLSGTFIVRTGAEKVKGLTVKLTGLPGKLYQIMYVHHTIPYYRKTWVGANHLLPAEPADLKPFYTYGWRIRLKGPARPGKYRGNIEVTANGHTEKLPVEVNIHPLKLPVLNDHLIAMDGDGIEGPYAADLMRFAKEELGCTTAHLRMTWPTVSKFETDKNGMPVKVISAGGYNAGKYDAWLDAFIKADFPVKTPWIGLMSMFYREPFKQGPFKPFTKEYCQAVKLSYEFLRDRARAKGLPGILVDFGGEMGYALNLPPKRTIADAIKLYQLVNGMPGVQTSYRCNCYATVEQFYPYLDVQGVRGNLSWKSADRITDYGRKKHIYSYSVGGRFRNGFHSWAHGARGNLREYMIYDHGFYRHVPYRFGMATMHNESAMSGVNQPLITVRSEAFRASVVDRQYLRMLDDAIQKAPQSAAGRKAEALRDLLRNTCLNFNVSEAYSDESSPWECLRLDLMRQAIAECVLNLQQNNEAAIPRYRKIAMPVQEERLDVPKINPAVIPEKARIDFDDEKWSKLNTGSWESQGYQYDGSAWFRKTFDLDELNSPRIVFEGVDEQAWVWLNGKFLGHHNGWNKPFSFPLDQAAVKGKNTLCVLVFDSSYQGGIWKPVKVVNGSSEQVLNRWKFIFDSEKKDMNVLQLSGGPLVPAGCTKLNLSMMLYRFPHVRMSSDMTLWLDGKKLPVQVEPYKKIEAVIPVDPVGKGAHRILLKSAGKIAKTYDFYGI